MSFCSHCTGNEGDNSGVNVRLLYLKQDMSVAELPSSALQTYFLPFCCSFCTGSENDSNSGVNVRLLYLKQDMSVSELPSSALHGVGAPELASGAVPDLEGGLAFKTLEVCMEFICVCV